MSKDRKSAADLAARSNQLTAKEVQRTGPCRRPNRPNPAEGRAGSAAMQRTSRTVSRTYAASVMQLEQLDRKLSAWLKKLSAELGEAARTARPAVGEVVRTSVRPAVASESFSRKG